MQTQYPFYFQQCPGWMTDDSHEVQFKTSLDWKVNSWPLISRHLCQVPSGFYQYWLTEANSENLSKILKGNIWLDCGCITAKAHRGRSFRKFSQEYSPFGFHELESRNIIVPSNTIVMSNSKGSLVITLPAYNSLNRILRLSFLMILTVGDLRLGPQKEQTQLFIRVYLNFARHFPVINKSIT